MLDSTSKAVAAVAVSAAALGGVLVTGNPACLWALLIVPMVYKVL